MKEIVSVQVIGVDLTEIQRGEAAITYLLSCNGPEFTVLLYFSIKKDKFATNAQGSHHVLLFYYCYR